MTTINNLLLKRVGTALFRVTADLPSYSESTGLSKLLDELKAALLKAGVGSFDMAIVDAAPVVADAGDEFYLQDSRSYVGNDVLWWAKGNAGYTTDLNNAQVYTKIEAQGQHNSRETDIPWPKAYIDQKTRPAVDMQYIDRKEALKGTGIVIKKPQKPKREPPPNCHACGSFLSETQYYGSCPKCGGDNRP